MLRLAKARQPTALLLENVTGLVSNPAVFAAVLHELAAVGYRVAHRVCGNFDIKFRDHLTISHAFLTAVPLLVFSGR